MSSDVTGRRGWLLDASAVLLFGAVLAVVAWRLSSFVLMPGKEPSLDRPGLASYRDVLHYPAIAVIDGVNPYDSGRDSDPTRYMNRYPVGSHFPLYSPLILLVHAPLAALPLGTGMVVFCALNVVLLVLFAWTAIKCCGLRPNIAGVFLLAAALLASQPGRANFNSGQAVLLLTLAACGALGRVERPWLGVLSLAILTVKPTFGGPLGLMILARRQWYVGLVGLGLGGLIAVALGAVIFARSGDLSVAGISSVLHGNHDHFSNDPEHYFEETNRLDTTAAIERLANRTLPGSVKIGISAGILALTGWAIWLASGRASPLAPNGQETAGSTTSALAILAMYLCVYHLVYDGLLLAVPALAAAWGKHSSWQDIPRAARRVILVLLLVPFLNVLWTGTFHSAMAKLGIPWGLNEGEAAAALFRVVSAANGVALTGAWIMLLRYTLRPPKL
jgi:hypothetical protein